MLLLLLLDAFRPDYLQKTAFLRYLAASGAKGVFQEPFGFCPRGTYFGGLSPGEVGYAFTFWNDRANSPFQSARLLPDDRNLSTRSQAFVREVLSAEARSNTTPFGASYIHPHSIPLRFLPEIDIAEKYPAWDRRVGYRSLFHELEERGHQWLYAGWPTLNDYHLRHDGEIVSWVLDHVRSEHVFVHVQFCELDAVGHEFGPGSPEVVQVLAETDRLVRLLVEGLMAKGHALDVLIFGDHGMVSVISEIDIVHHLSALSVQAPTDYLYFLDSTIARFWYRHSAARNQIIEALGAVRGGRILNECDKVAYGIESLDRRCGEDIFLADPGCLIAPSFFHGPGQSPRGMHGYDPAEPDNQGVFIAAGPHFRPATDAGLVQANQLYPLCRSILFEPPASISFDRAVQHGAPQGAESYDLIVARDLEVIQRCIAETDPDPGKTVVLAGSFGRGEGAVVPANGSGRAVNDYDVLVFSKTTVDPVMLKGLRDALAKQLGLPFVDLTWYDPAWISVPERSIFRYDLRYGAKVISGDHAFLERLPHLAEHDIPSAEILRLLCNRAAGVLMALKPHVLSSQELAEGDREFFWIQVMKAGTALADHYLFKWSAYHTSYRVRRRRFAALGEASCIEEDLRTAIDACFAFKLEPAPVLVQDPRQVLRRLRPAWSAAICSRMALESSFHTGEILADDVQRASDLEKTTIQYLQQHRSAEVPTPEGIRALAPMLLLTLDEGLKPLPNALEGFVRTPEVAELIHDLNPEVPPLGTNFEYLRKRVVAIWEEHCH